MSFCRWVRSGASRIHGWANLYCAFHHRRVPPKPVSLALLQELGVLYWCLDADKYETDPKLAAIRKVCYLQQGQQVIGD